MAVTQIRDAKIYFREFDISGDLNKVTLVTGADMLEDTAFGANYHTMKPGLKKLSGHVEGYTQFGAGITAIDGRMRGSLGVADVPMMFAADGGDVSELAYFCKALEGQYTFGGKVGELIKFQSDFSASGINEQLVAGTIMEDGKTARTIAGNSNTIALGAVSSTQKVWCALFLQAFTGTNVTFTVKSATTDFSTITQRAAFTQNTTVGSEILAPVSGAITDTFWRVFWTGTFTSFNAVLVVGIQ